MKTLIIYDNNGVIFHQIAGDYIKPEGLQYLEVEVPEGKYVTGVNVETHEPIFADIPPNEIEKLRLEMAANNTELFETMIMMMSGGME